MRALRLRRDRLAWDVISPWRVQVSKTAAKCNCLSHLAKGKRNSGDYGDCATAWETLMFQNPHFWLREYHVVELRIKWLPRVQALIFVCGRAQWALNMIECHDINVCQALYLSDPCMQLFQQDFKKISPSEFYWNFVQPGTMIIIFWL